MSITDIVLRTLPAYSDYVFIARTSLVPPSLASSAEIVFGPRRKENLSTAVLNVTMSESKREWRRPANDGSLRRVLRWTC